MCTFVYVTFCNRFLFLLCALRALGLTIVQHFPKKGDSAALLPQSGKNTVNFSRNW